MSNYGERKLTEVLKKFENMTKEEYLQLYDKAKDLEKQDNE